MEVDGQHYRTIWPDPNADGVCIIDQTRLPHHLEVLKLTRLAEIAESIRSMRVRGAPLIGASAAFGLALALAEDDSLAHEEAATAALLATRPTAVNLRWALDRVRVAVAAAAESERAAAAWSEAERICDEDASTCEAIGTHGLETLRKAMLNKRTSGESLQILTHCNAGWLATVDWGTALAPIYKAHRAGLPVHVWVDETRPRNQGASLTAWELSKEGVAHTLVVDNAGGHLMQHDLVDLCIVGSDRTTARGDVCNKIGTYLKALAAADNGVPFHVALPLSSIDWRLGDGVREIPIEERDASEVLEVEGISEDGVERSVRIAPEGTAAANYGFDVTPARLVTSLITERGACPANEESLRGLLADVQSKPSS